MRITATEPERIATMSRAVAYADGYGVRVGVSYDNTYHLSDTNERFVKIAGIGGDVHVSIKDVQFLLDALNEPCKLNDQVQA